MAEDGLCGSQRQRRSILRGCSALAFGMLELSESLKGLAVDHPHHIAWARSQAGSEGCTQLSLRETPWRYFAKDPLTGKQAH
jgi:hypothetical protein